MHLYRCPIGRRATSSSFKLRGSGKVDPHSDRLLADEIAHFLFDWIQSGKRIITRAIVVCSQDHLPPSSAHHQHPSSIINVIILRPSVNTRSYTVVIKSSIENKIPAKYFKTRSMHSFPYRTDILELF